MSLRDIEELLAKCNVIVSYESIRQWCARFDLEHAKRLRKRCRPGGDRWFLDEVTVSIQGKRQYLWRAVDQDGDVLDVLVQSRKDKHANNRSEVSHERTREQERQTRRFASSGQAQRFLSVHGQVHNLFRVGRHLLRAANFRVLRGRVFAVWQELTCVQ